MNLNPAEWFWTQILVIIIFITVYITMSFTPWYYDIGVKEAEGIGLKAMIINRINDSSEVAESNSATEFEKKYVNGGRMSSLDIIIVLGYVVSLSYVLGLFLSSTKTFLIVNSLPLIALIIKTLGIRNVRDVYKWSLRNVIVWWICLIIYYMATYLHDRLIVTDIVEYK